MAVLASSVESRQALNIIGHLAISIGAHADTDLMGRPLLIDASGREHLGIAKFPFIITKVKSSTLLGAIVQARADKRILVADFPELMLHTGHDDELALALAAADENSIRYLGAIFYGPSDAVDAITGRFSLWQQ